MPKQPKKRGRGRPPVPKAQRRDTHLHKVRATDAENRKVERDAKAAGMEIAEFIRARLGL